nr:tubulin alpha 8 trucated form [Homo sapiens]
MIDLEPTVVDRCLLWPAGLPDFPQFWWGHWLRLHFSADGTPLPGLWQEIQAGVCHLPSPPGLYCSGGALQLHPDHPHHTGTFRLCFHGGQRSHL